MMPPPITMTDACSGSEDTAVILRACFYTNGVWLIWREDALGYTAAIVTAAVYYIDGYFFLT